VAPKKAETMTKVLVVEDEPSAVAVVKYHFESAGVDGLYASRADEGWRMLVSHRPEAMVADITLPGEDGWSLIERVRRDGRFGGLPVVVLTGEVEEGEAARAKSLGCEYLTKPFSATALLTKLSSLLNRVTESPSHPPAGEPVPQIKLIGVGVVILLDHYRIEGTIHLPPELSRFSDAWESVVRDSRTFFPVTRAKLMSRDGMTVLSSPAFVEVRKSEVRAVFPQDLTPAEGNGFLA
jgi:CheY-like chemotaxis protein